MAINKITPRSLDKATDHKLVPATAFIDAVNVIIDEDESIDGDGGGDAGVIKNLRGNTSINYHTSKDAIAAGDFKIIGTTTDHKLKLVYFFVYHQSLSEQGVWVYDPYGNLSLPTYYAKQKRSQTGLPLLELDGVDPYQTNTIKCVVKGSFFNFKQNSVVQGNVVYGNTLNVPDDIAGDILSSSYGSIFSIKSSDRNTFEKDFHLYFTDNINEPKKICVNGCLFARAIQYDSFEVEGGNSQYAAADFNGDGVIDDEDVAIFLDLIGEIIITGGPQIVTDSEGNTYVIEDPSALDFNGDGSIGQLDLDLLLEEGVGPVSPPIIYPGAESRFQSYEGGFFSIPANNAPEIEKIKFCHACKPTPLVRPTFEFTQDNSSSVNNFERQEGFKFAYQIFYNDGTKSAISPKSEIAIPPSILFQGANKNPNHSSYNVCNISINLFDINPQGLWNHVKQVNILAQQGDGGYSIIHEAKGLAGSLSFNFKNDILGIPVASKEENKFFDSVPLKAEAQSVVDNRLMYGNYVEGFPNENIEAELSVIYDEASNEGFVGPVEVIPCIVSHQNQASTSDDEMFEKSSGFRIRIPDGAFPSLSVGNLFKFSVKFFPNRNFHLYKGVDSFHQSRHWGVQNSDEESQNDQGFQTPNQSGLYHFLGAIEGPSADLTSLEEFPISSASDFNAQAVVQSEEQRFFPAYSKNGGIASGIWQPFDGYNEQPGPVEVDFGTSAANPFIIPGAVLTFGIELRCISSGDSDTMRTAFFDLARTVMSGQNGYSTAGNSYFSVESVTNFSTTEWDLNLGYIERFEEGSSLSKLISAGVYDLSNIPNFTHPDGVMPVAHVIPNKGKATFRLSPVSSSGNDLSEYQLPAGQGETNETATFSIRFCNANDLELRTCVRKWMPGSPWWALSRDFTNGVLDESVSTSVFYDQTQYTLPSYANDINMRYIGWSGYDPEVDPPQNAFDQFNDARDFAYPGGGYTVIYYASGGSIASGDIFTGFEFGNINDYFKTSSKYLLGHFQSFSGSVSGSGGIFPGVDIGSPFVVNQFGQINPANGVDVSLMDGEGGPGGRLPNETSQLDHFEFSLNGRNPIYNGVDYASTSYGYVGKFKISNNQDSYVPFWVGPYFNGRLFTTLTITENQDYPPVGGNFVGLDMKPLLQSEYNGSFGNNYGARTVMPYIQGPREGILQQSDTLGVSGDTETVYLVADQIFSDPYEGYTDSGAVINNPYLQFSFANAGCFIEQFGSLDLGSLSLSSSSSRTFKSNSDHDFGIVFYDNHGRRSFVNPLGSVNVKGFGASRGENKGRAKVSVNLIGNAPNWARKYQFVYGGNRSMSDFIQYTTNNAYVENTALSESDIDVNNGKIYISLNMLQDSTISYSKEFGARGSDGSLSIYKFSPGDKLRVISYGPSTNRQYPENLVYDIIDVVRFDPLEDAESNPLIEDISTADARPSSRYGEFVVVSNKDVDGFSYADIVVGSSKWHENVVFEIFTPKKFTSADEKVYQEIGEVYDISYNSLNGQSLYSSPQVVLYEGDSYIRPVAVNTNKLVDGEFEDLLSVDENATDGSNLLKSNFTNSFLETTTASDLFPSEIKHYGRFNVASSNARQVRREAGIIYSERSSQDSRYLNYSSFNASLYPFKDLEERFGNINFMDELGGNLFVIQQDRCTVIPVSATILSNAVGEDQLIASNDILGKERVYSTKAGCDNNPESVVRIDNTYYFAHKSLGKIFRFIEGQGIEEISDASMSSYFRFKFNEALNSSANSDKRDIRIVGGYDPVKDEYLITILTPNPLNTSSSDDTVVIYGCIDPNALNYNPAATVSNNTCEYPGEDPDGFACASLDDNSISLGEVEVFDVAQTTRTIQNTGSRPLTVGNLTVQNNEDNIFTATISSYVIQPNDSATITITANCNTVGNFNSSVLVTFINSSAANECANDISIPVSVTVIDEVVDPFVGVVTINFYIGGTLVDQQFADSSQGVWNVTIDQNRLIQQISNSYSGEGGVADVEVEIIFDDTPGVVIENNDSITIEGEIIDGVDGFEFIP